MNTGIKIGSWIRWIILIPVWGISLCLTGLAWIGTGFGGGWFIVGFLCAFPVSLLNFWSARIAAIGMWLVLFVTYLPVAVRNWPIINPVQLLNSGADLLLLLVVGLTQLASLAPKLNRYCSPASNVSS